MEFRREQLKVYAITDRSWLGEQTLAQAVESALAGGATMVQLREKHLDEETFIGEAKELLLLCHRYHVPLIINDNVKVAKLVGADGVHVGQSDMEISKVREILGENAVIGVTAKTVEQAKAAEAAGATYLGSGAVFGHEYKIRCQANVLRTVSTDLRKRKYSGGRDRWHLRRELTTTDRSENGRHCCGQRNFCQR